jgi:hypothetical protein
MVKIVTEGGAFRIGWRPWKKQERKRWILWNPLSFMVFFDSLLDMVHAFFFCCHPF